MAEGLLCVVEKDQDLGDLIRSGQEWPLTKAPDLVQAHYLLGQQPFQVILVDSGRLICDTSGFLAKVSKQYPDITRVVLFDPTDKKQVVRTDGLTQQCVTRPCSAETLASAVKRARMINRWLGTPAVQQLFPQMKNVPSVPAVYFRLLRELESVDAGIEDIGKIIAQDLALTAKVLQMVNSAVFGLGHEVTHPMDAVSYLGIDHTKSLVLLAHTFASINSKDSLFPIDQLWHHSMLCAQYAQWIAREETADRRVADQAYTAAMLHDLGKLMMGINVPKLYQDIMDFSANSQLPMQQAELEMLGTSHAEFGACILGIWGLPSDIVEAIAYHHAPSQHPGDEFDLVTAVHAANVIEHQLRESEGEKPEYDMEYLQRLGLQARPDQWRDLCNRRN